MKKLTKMKMIVEAKPAAAQKFAVLPSATLAEQLSQMPPVTFSNQAQPLVLWYGLTLGDIPALTYTDNLHTATEAAATDRCNPFGIRFYLTPRRPTFEIHMGSDFK